MDSYVLRGGEKGAERLRLLARVTWPTTEALLRRIGLGAGQRCLAAVCDFVPGSVAWIAPRFRPRFSGVLLQRADAPCDRLTERPFLVGPPGTYSLSSRRRGGRHETCPSLRS